MAYVLDFTAVEHARRKMFRITCVVMTVLTLVFLSFGARITYQVYTSPTLADRLVTYQGPALQLEEISEIWKTTAGEYGALLPYYRLLWSDGITNALPKLIEWTETRPLNVVPRKWKLVAGGDCVLGFSLNLEPKQKKEQLTLTRDWLLGVTNHLCALNAKIDDPAAAGDLGDLKTVEMTLRFSLEPKYKAFPPPPPALEAACKKISSFREKLHAYVIGHTAVGKASITLDSLIMEETKSLDVKWRNRRAKVIDPEQLWREMDAADVTKPACSRDLWRTFASAKWPWRRVRALESDLLNKHVQELSGIAAALPRKSLFMKQREIMSAQRSPLLEGYNEDDVFNENLAKEQLSTAVKVASIVGSVKLSRGKEEVKVETAKNDAEGNAIHVDVNFADWTLTINKEESGSFRLDSLRGAALAVPSLGSGFELGGLEVEFSSGSEIEKAVLTGKVPVRK